MPRGRSEDFVTKQGEHGTLYLHRIVYRDKCMDGDDGWRGETRLFAYDKEHAIDRFWSTAIDDGFEPVAVSRYKRLRHRETVESLV